MSEEAAVALPSGVGCIIASGTVIPELARMRSNVDEVLREHRHHDDRLSRLHLQSDDASRRLDRLERLVETQTQESHQLSKRIDAIDVKVTTVADSVETMSANVIDTKLAVRQLTNAFDAHGIKADEQHYKRIKASRALWLALFGILGILSVLHFGATGSTPLQSVMTWLGGVAP